MRNVKDIEGNILEVADTEEGDPISASAFSAIGDGVINQEVFNPTTNQFEVAGFNFKVSASAPATMNVIVNNGSAIIKGQVLGSKRILANQPVATVILDAADPTNPRKDIIALKSTINEFGQVKHIGKPQQEHFCIIKGTPATTPVVAKSDATLNAEGKIRIATITVPAGATGINTGDIDNGKDYLGALTITKFTDLSDVPASFVAGQFVKANAGGTALEFSADVNPVTDNSGNMGTDSLRWARVRASEVVTGDLKMHSVDGLVKWTLKEEQDGIYMTNEVTGKRYKINMTEV